MTIDEKMAMSHKLKNTFRRSYLLPVIKIFTDVQVEASRAAIEDPEKYKLNCVNDYTLEKKFYDNYSKIVVGDSRVKQVAEDAVIEHARIADVKKFMVVADEFSAALKFNCKEKVSIFMHRARGVNLTISDTVPDKTCYEVQNAYNIYSGEAFTISVKFDDAWVAISPTMVEGKSGKLIELWFWSPETGVLVDDANKYFDCSALLNLFRG